MELYVSELLSSLFWYVSGLSKNSPKRDRETIRRCSGTGSASRASSKGWESMQGIYAFLKLLRHVFISGDATSSKTTERSRWSILESLT